MNFVPKGVNSLTIEATLDFPTRRKSRASRNPERERERLHGTRDIRNAARLNYESINAKLSDHSRIRNRSIESRERERERDF